MYHNRCPSFTEEFKIRLPAKINKQTHLLFTFIHVHTKPKVDTPVDEVVGYTWLPLWRDDCLRTGKFSLPVLAEMPTPGYSFLNPSHDCLPNVKWIDNHKPLFTVHLESYSSIYAQDKHIDQFFRITSSFDTQAHISSYMHSSNLYEEFCRAISNLSNADLDSLVKFVHIILNRLILLLVRPPQLFFNQNKSNGETVRSFHELIFQTMIMIVAKINQALLYDDMKGMRSGILGTFVQYQVIFPQPEVRYEDLGLKSKTENSVKPFHEKIVQLWLNGAEPVLEQLYDNAFFFFDLVFKSFCIHQSLNGGLSQSTRTSAPKSFLNSISDLINLIGDYVVSETKRSLGDIVSPSTPQSPCPTSEDLLPNLNQSIGFFIRDLLSVLDRHFVFNLIKTYCRKLSIMMPSASKSFQYLVPETNSNNSSNSKNLSDQLFDLKVDFLRVLCGHEHFAALNLPIGTPLFTALEQSPATNNNPPFSPSSSLAKVMLNSSLFSHSIFDSIRPYAELTDDYRRQHWLLGLVFCTLMDSFTRPKNELQCKAANLVRSILTSFDWDPKYKGEI